MLIQIGRITKALDEGHRAGAGGAVRLLAFPHLMRGSGPVHDAQHFAHNRRVGGELEPQRIREAQDLGLTQNNLRFSHPIFGPSLNDPQSQNPQISRASPVVLLSRIVQI